MPEGFPLPSQHAIAKHTANASMFLPAWKNTTVFTKRVSFETSNPFIFDNYYKLIEEYPVLKDSVLKNPIVYLSDQILPICQADVLKNSVIKKLYLFMIQYFNNYIIKI